MIHRLLAVGGFAALILAGAAVPAAAAGPPPIINCHTQYGHQGVPACNPAYNGHLLNGNASLPGLQVTSVTATWTVPAIVCNRKQAALGAYDSIWVGLFYTDGTLVQTGVDDACVHTVHPYQRETAFWEVTPAAETPLSLPVDVGDSITATVTASGNGNYVVSLTDTRNGTEIWDFGKSITVPGETGYPYADGVVIEPHMGVTGIPGVFAYTSQVGPLADFGTVTFTNVRYNDTTGTAYPSDVQVYEAQTPQETSVEPVLLTWAVTWKHPGHYIPFPVFP